MVSMETYDMILNNGYVPTLPIISSAASQS